MPRAFKKKTPKTKCKSVVVPFIQIYWKRDLGFLKLEEKEQEEILQALIEETWKVLFYFSQRHQKRSGSALKGKGLAT